MCVLTGIALSTWRSIVSWRALLVICGAGLLAVALVSPTEFLTGPDAAFAVGSDSIDRLNLRTDDDSAAERTHVARLALAA